MEKKKKGFTNEGLDPIDLVATFSSPTRMSVSSLVSTPSHILTMYYKSELVFHSQSEAMRTGDIYILSRGATREYTYERAERRGEEQNTNTERENGKFDVQKAEGEKKKEPKQNERERVRDLSSRASITRF